MDLTFESGGWWAYLLVFLAAAIPVLEILVVIPAGVVAGLSPVPTALVALAGNMSTVVLVAIAGDRILRWWRRKRSSKRPDDTTSPRSERARRLLQRWGVPGLAFLAPITTGTHLATIAALATGAEQRTVLRWMAVGLAVWAGVVGAAATAGLSLF